MSRYSAGEKATGVYTLIKFITGHRDKHSVDKLARNEFGNAHTARIDDTTLRRATIRESQSPRAKLIMQQMNFARKTKPPMHAKCQVVH